MAHVHSVYALPVTPEVSALCTASLHRVQHMWYTGSACHVCLGICSATPEHVQCQSTHMCTEWHMSALVYALCQWHCHTEWHMSALCVDWHCQSTVPLCVDWQCHIHRVQHMCHSVWTGTASLHRVQHMCCILCILALPVYTECSTCATWYMALPVYTEWHMSALVYWQCQYTQSAAHVCHSVYALPVHTEWHMSDMCLGICTASLHRVAHVCLGICTGSAADMSALCVDYAHRVSALWYGTVHTQVQHMSALVYALPVHIPECSTCLPLCICTASAYTRVQHMCCTMCICTAVYTEWHMSALVYALPVYTDMAHVCLGICTAMSTQCSGTCLPWYMHCQSYTSGTCLPLCVYWHCQYTKADMCHSVWPWYMHCQSTQSAYTKADMCCTLCIWHCMCSTCAALVYGTASLHRHVLHSVYALPVHIQNGRHVLPWYMHCQSTQSGTCLPWYMHCQSTQSGTCLPWYMHCQSTQSGTCLPWYMHCQSTQSGTCLPWYMHCQSTQSGTCLPWYMHCQSTQSGICDNISH